MGKKKRALIHEKLLDHVGVDYSKFIPLETATIINLTIKSNSNYKKLFENIENPTDFLLKSVRYSNLPFDNYELLIKKIKNKKEELNETEIENVERKIEELKNKISELKNKTHL